MSSKLVGESKQNTQQAANFINNIEQRNSQQMFSYENSGLHDAFLSENWEFLTSRPYR